MSQEQEIGSRQVKNENLPKCNLSLIKFAMRHLCGQSIFSWPQFDLPSKKANVKEKQGDGLKVHWKNNWKQLGTALHIK